MIMINETKFNTLVGTLTCIYGIVAIIIGVDKFFFYIVDWNMYVSSTILSYLPTPIAINIVPIVGIIEIAAGIIILSRYTRFGAYLVAAWIGVVIINLLTIGDMYDIILRDIAIMVGYITLGILVKLKETAQHE